MKKTIVEENMSKNVVTACWSEDLLSAYNRMVKANVRHLVVVDEFKFLRGVISDRDFKRAMYVYSDFLFNDNSRIGFDSNSIVRDYMSWPAETASSKSTIKEIANQMIDKKISALVITENDEDAIGVITHEDLLRILIHTLEKESPSIKDRFEGFAYNSPIGLVINTLKDMGI